MTKHIDSDVFARVIENSSYHLDLDRGIHTAKAKHLNYVLVYCFKEKNVYGLEIEDFGYYTEQGFVQCVPTIEQIKQMKANLDEVYTNYVSHNIKPFNVYIVDELKKYTIVYWARNEYGDKDWCVKELYAKNQDEAKDILISLDPSIKLPLEIHTICKN